MKKSPRKTESGYTLIEVLVAAALMPGLVFGAMQIFKIYGDSGLKARQLGIKEDARNFVRMNLDCKETARRELATCKTGGYIRGYNAAGYALSTSASEGQNFDGTKVRIHCSNDGVSLNIQPEIKIKGSNNFESLDGVPITCKICGVDVASLPATFPPAPIAAGPHRLLSYINNKMVECGEPGIPGNSILHSTGAGSQRGKDKPFIIGTVSVPTMEKVCNMLGFRTYVSSSCVENDHRDYRCNYTSPGDNDHIYWNGSRWVSTGNPSYWMSWLSQITCDDPM